MRHKVLEFPSSGGMGTSVDSSEPDQSDISTAPDGPHISGLVTCINCSHEWAAVAPIGQTLTCLPCSKCGGDTGFKKYLVEHTDRPHWMCNCGCYYFSITPDRIYCINCGADQVF